MLTRSKKAALGLALAGEPDAAVRAELRSSRATCTLAALLDMEYGTVAVAPGLDRGSGADGWQRRALSALLRYGFDGDARGLDDARAALPVEPSEPGEQRLATAVRVHVAAELGEVETCLALLSDERIDEALRARLRAALRPMAFLDEVLASPSSATIGPAVDVAVRSGLSDAFLERLLSGEAVGEVPLDGDVALLRSVARRDAESVLAALLPERNGALPDDTDVAVLAYRLTRHGRVVVACRLPGCRTSAVAISERMVRSALHRAQHHVLRARPMPDGWGAAAIWAWNNHRREGEGHLTDLAHSLIPDDLLSTIERGDLRHLIIETSSVFDQVPFESLPVPSGRRLGAATSVWRLPPTSVGRSPNPSEPGCRPSLLLQSRGVVAPLSEHVTGLDQIDLGDVEGGLVLPGTVGDGVAHRSVVYHGHGTVGADVGRPELGADTGSGAVVDGAVQSLSAMLPPGCRGLVAVSCEAAGLRSRAANNWRGLTSDAFASGVDWALAPLWPIPDSAGTNEMVRHIIDELGREDPATALRHARQWAEEEGLSPMHWLSWACFGLPAGRT
jgi:hypothetical protein